MPLEYCEYDFPEIQGVLNWKSTDYRYGHTNRQKAWTLLSVVSNLREIHNKVFSTAGDYTDDGKLFQQILVLQGVNALESIYWLTKHHQYNAARGRLRYLFETYGMLRELNKDQDDAANKWAKVLVEAWIVDSGKLGPLEKQTDILHDFRTSAKESIKDEIDINSEYIDFWRMLSDRGSYPASMRGALADARQSTISEESLLTLALVFAFGIIGQWVRTFAGTNYRKILHATVDQLFVEIKFAIKPRGLPTLFEQELYFWTPARAGSPFVDYETPIENLDALDRSLR